MTDWACARTAWWAVNEAPRAISEAYLPNSYDSMYNSCERAKERGEKEEEEEKEQEEEKEKEEEKEQEEKP